jgi:chromate reductase, NAD(P)H dehydrogenase (quinone)
VTDEAAQPLTDPAEGHRDSAPGDGALRILLICGSTRAASTNLAVLRTVCEVAPDAGTADAGTADSGTADSGTADSGTADSGTADSVTAALYEGLAGLPAFNPDNDGENAPAVVADLRRELAEADAVIFCTPEYAGTLPGSLKNLLDWTVSSGDLYGKPVAWINAANAGRGEGAQATLTMVLGYVGAAVIEEACLRLPGARDAVGPDGLIRDPGIRGLMARSVEEIARHVRAAADSL